ncbi:MAG: hypothetical protein ACREQ5_11900 [Candidatus Dormibacteria bacterium]
MLLSEREAARQAICTGKTIGVLNMKFNGPTIAAIELAIQTLQETIPALRAAGVE